MICIAWSGFPQYAARCVGAFAKTMAERVVVVATHPKVPVTGMEELAGCEVRWIANDECHGIMELLGEVPRVFVVSGWGTVAFNRMRDEAKACGARIVGMSDNNFVFSFKEIVKAIRFRMMLRGRYDDFLVPGRSAERLLRFYGFPKEHIHFGMYAADDAVFKCGDPLVMRPKKILFVGQLCRRKNVVNLAKAFLSVDENTRKGWTLEICGCGPDRPRIPADRSIVVHDFVQPEELAKIYQSARVFALPSREEHWGVVVHEAAVSGCALLLSRQVGAADDFVDQANAFLFDSNSNRELKDAVVAALNMTDEKLDLAYAQSIQRGKSICINGFVKSLVKVCR